MSSNASPRRTAHRAMFAAVKADPEARLLNMREQREVIAAHAVDTYRFPSSTQWGGHCSCGVVFVPGNRIQIEASRDSHVRDALERAKGRKCAEARANAAIDRALVEGLGL